MSKDNPLQISTYSIYRRQYNKICQLVENGEFKSKSELIREALDFFFMFPYFKEMAKQEVTKEIKQQLCEEFYNKKVIKVLE